MGLHIRTILRGKDLYGNAMNTSASIHFQVDTSKHALRWTSLSYDDSQWNHGSGPFGGTNDVSSVTHIGSATTAYFRHKITLDSVENKTSLRLYIKGREGAIIYVNGQELGRFNMTTSSDVSYNTFALDTSGFINQRIPTFGSINQRFINGENIIAAEIHTGNGKKVGVAFDSYLVEGGRYYYPFGSLWNYYDLGNMPGDQVADKTTDAALGMESLLPKKMILYANYPNPFNPTTTIRYELPAKSHVSMKIFDLLGREIATLVDETNPAGMYSVQFNAGILSSGMYFCRLQAAHSVAVSKLMLVK